MKKGLLCFGIFAFIIFTLGAIYEYHTYEKEVHCYDNYNNVIVGAKCIDNDKFGMPILLLVYGIMILGFSIVGAIW